MSTLRKQYEETSSHLVRCQTRCAELTVQVAKLKRIINRAGALASQKASHQMIIDTLADVGSE